MCATLSRWDEYDEHEFPALEAVQELHKLSESHPENQRIIGRNRMVLEGVVHVLQNGGAKSKLWCCAVLVNLAYRSEENTAKIGAALLRIPIAMTHVGMWARGHALMRKVSCCRVRQGDFARPA